MNHSLPLPGDSRRDNDHFINRRLWDFSRSMWRFKFCAIGDASTCDTKSWTGGRLFEFSTGVIRRIFVTPAVVKDRDGNLWVQWGTGDKTDPTEKTTRRNCTP